MSIFQIIAIFFAAFMIYVVRIHFRKLKLSKLELSFWYSLWLVFIVIALFPDWLLGITQILQFTRVFDLLIVIALMILTTIVIMSYFLQRENSKKLEEFVRKQAIEESQKKK
ncbi:MAG: DUF2304 family protein [Candidatus Pacebacteria bacterium]|nr:DUF2304 family protein [Candidatus Paceibacterota bacterium]